MPKMELFFNRNHSMPLLSKGRGERLSLIRNITNQFY